MAELKLVLADLGFTSVESYIQSGNVKFEAPPSNPSTLAQNIQQKLKDDFGYEVPVIVLQKEKLEQVVSSNPYLNNGVTDIKALYVTFLSSLPSVEKLQLLKDLKSDADQFEVKGNVIYLYCPKGYGRTKFTNNLFEKKLETKATSRNWKTVLKLLEMAS